jgi:hypothetical protein
MKPFLNTVHGLISLLLLCSGITTPALTLSLQEQGGLSGLVVGGGGTVTITTLATDHWQVTLQDPRIGNPTSPSFNLAFIEPETVAGMTAYNNIQLLNIVPGTAVFDVLSDEFSPYSTIVPNGNAAPIQNTDVDLLSIKFTDFADTVPEPGSYSLLLGGAVLVSVRRQSGRTRTSCTLHAVCEGQGAVRQPRVERHMPVSSRFRHLFGKDNYAAPMELEYKLCPITTNIALLAELPEASPTIFREIRVRCRARRELLLMKSAPIVLAYLAPLVCSP